MPKTVVVFSGGLDSTVLLYYLRSRGHELRALSVNYGQRHAKELEVAARTAATLEIQHRVVDLSGLRPLLAGSALTSFEIAIPEGHYANESMAKTVVPNRNMLLLAVAGAWAVSTGSEIVAYGAHAGDHPVYPDCRPRFISAMTEALDQANDPGIKLFTPFVDLTKAQIVMLGAGLHVPFEKTWSCYATGKVHCSRCGTCYERREAFILAGVEDPTPYAISASEFDTFRKEQGVPHVDP